MSNVKVIVQRHTGKTLKENVTHIVSFLFLSFRRVLNVICSFLANSPASVS